MVALQVTPLLRLQTGPFAGQVYALGPSTRIGRHPYNEVSLGDESVSRYHCWIRTEAGATVLEDLASSNGTFLNGQRLLQEGTLTPGDRFRVGAVEFLYAEED